MLINYRNIFQRTLKKSNANWKVRIISKLLNKNEKVLDFGCGDLSFSKELHKANRSLRITGVDIVDFNVKDPNIKFVRYDGKKLPFKDSLFDVVVIFYVLHHCEDIKKILQECLRVTKKRILIIESVPHSRIEFPLMNFLDYLFNVWKSGDIPLPYTFLYVKEWMKLFKTLKVRVIHAEHIDRSLLGKLPIGKMYLFELQK